jgi:MoxR-like ATPase
MLPSDVTGTSIFNQENRKFEFRPGPLFGQIILADEINRATPKTQAALLEAMEERQVTVDGQTHPLPRPFMVLATQNPIEYEGTFPLPEAQLDRFLLRLRLGYPGQADEIRILENQQLRHPIESVEAVISADEVIRAAEAVREIFVSPAVKRYIVDLVSRTRQHADIYLGASPRGSLSLFRAAQARAGLLGRDYVLPDDVKALAGAILAHRMIVNPAARLREVTAEKLVQEILLAVAVPAAHSTPDMRNPARAFLLLLFLIGLAGSIINGAVLYVRMAYLGGLLLGAAWLWTFLSLRKIRFSRQARSLRASVGDTFEETFDLNNDSRLPRLWVEIENHSDLPNAAGSRLLTNVGGKEGRSYLARTWLTQRGVYRLGPTTLASGDPFGLFTVKRTFSHADSLLVLPLILPIVDFPSPAGYLPGGKAIRRKSFEITPHASGVREYIHGDPLKRIHWPTSARRDRLMVKEFEQDPQAEIWLFLDAQAGLHHALSAEPLPKWHDWTLQRRPQLSLPPDSLEYAITITASLAHYFINQRRAVGFVTEGPAYTVIPAERSERQEAKLLETLAFVQARGRLPSSAWPMPSRRVSRMGPAHCW